MALARRLHEEQVNFRETKPGTVYQTRMNAEPEPPDSVHDTLPKQFLQRVKTFGANQVAMRKKRFGIWQEYTWQAVYEHVSNFFHGLKSMGLSAGETVVVIGENDPEMYWTQIAAHSASAMTCGVFADALPDPDLVYVVASTNATFIIAHDQEQVDKALSIKEKIPQIRKVIYWDDKGMWSYDDDWLMSFEEVEAVGREHRKKSHPDLFEQSIGETKFEDTIILSMTSGTTSLPKFAMLTNHDMMWRTYAQSAFFPALP